MTRILFSTSLLLIVSLACGGAPTPEAGDAEPAPATAEAPAPEPEQVEPAQVEPTPDPVWMVITATTTNRAEAEEQAAQHEELPGQPMVFDTDAIDGLKAGLFVVSPARTRDEATAKHLAAGYGRIFEGAYVKRVVGPAGERIDCERDRPDPRCVVGDGMYRALVAFDRTGEAGSGDWATFSEEVLLLVGGAGIDAKWAADDGPTPISLYGEQATTIDIEPFADEGRGYVAVMEGKEPRFIAHDMPNGVISTAEGYFGLNVVQPHEM